MIAMVRVVWGALRAAAIGALLIGGTVRAADAAAPPPDVPASQQVLVLLNLPPQHYRPDGNYAGSYADAAGHAARRRVAARLAREHGLSMDSDWPMPLLGVDCFVMTVPPDQSPGRIAQDLARDGRVAWTQTMNVYRAQGHDDPLFALQPAARDWQLALLHETVTGRQVRVAVIDSGVERTHPDLVHQVELSEDFVAARGSAPAEAHGTAVAGIIAAQADNGIGIVGIAPQARVLALRGCWQQAVDATLCSSLTLAQALQFAITHDAQVINLSLSGPPDQLLARLLDVALGRGIAVVAAVDRGAAGGGFPAAHRGVVAVADAPSGPSGSVASTVVIAPGRDIPTTVTGARWALVSGSSYAAAHVSGLLALLREARERHGATASTVGTLAARDLVLLPDGRIDACASLSRVAGLCSCDCTAANAGPTVARQ
jgi:subtilisin family serine protease